MFAEAVEPGLAGPGPAFEAGAELMNSGPGADQIELVQPDGCVEAMDSRQAAAQAIDKSGGIPRRRDDHDLDAGQGPAECQRRGKARDATTEHRDGADRAAVF